MYVCVSVHIYIFQILLYYRLLQDSEHSNLCQTVHFSYSGLSDSFRPHGLHAARQPYLFITNSQSLLKLMSIESVMPSNHFILCHPLLLLPSIFPSIRVFSNESALRIRWSKYWRSLLFYI